MASITVPLDDADKQSIIRVARAKRLAPSAWARMRLIEAAEREERKAANDNGN